MTYLRRSFQLDKIIQTYPAINKLLQIHPRGGGRNNLGRIIFRKQGGGAKKFLRILDFKKVLWNMPFYVLRVEKDPFRTGFIQLICFVNGMVSYTLSPEGVEKMEYLLNSYSYYFLAIGQSVCLNNLEEGSFIHSLEKKYLNGGEVARSAGTAITVLKQFRDGRILLRYPSKEEILANQISLVTVGRVSNPDHKFVRILGAGKQRRLGIKPVVRGVARNPVDHPHGGAGGRHQVTFWSKIAKNKVTRDPDLVSTYIYLSRKKKRKKSKK